MYLLRLIVRYDSDSQAFVAMCCDFDMVTQASKLEDIPQAFGHVFYGDVLVGLENGAQVPRRAAPPHIKKLWYGAGTRAHDLEVKPWSEFIPPWVPEAFSKAILQSKALPNIDQPEQVLMGISRVHPCPPLQGERHD